MPFRNIMEEDFLYCRISVLRRLSVSLGARWRLCDFIVGPMAATSLITLLPVLLLVWLMQKQFVQGLAMGAVKG